MPSVSPHQGSQLKNQENNLQPGGEGQPISPLSCADKSLHAAIVRMEANLAEIEASPGNVSLLVVQFPTNQPIDSFLASVKLDI